MEELILVAVGAFLVAALTVPAGFGLSTMLTPMVLLLMGPHEAVAVVARIRDPAADLARFIECREERAQRRRLHWTEAEVAPLLELRPPPTVFLRPQLEVARLEVKAGEVVRQTVDEAL